MCGYAVHASSYRLLIRGIIAALRQSVHLTHCPVSSGHLNRVLRGGALISAVSEPDPNAAAARSVRSGFMLVEVRSDVLRQLGGRFSRGTLQPFVGSVLPLSEAATAHRMLDGLLPTTPGKIVLRTHGADEDVKASIAGE